MKVKIKKLHEDAKIPQYATDGSGCFDLTSVNDGVLVGGATRIYDTGLAFEIPEGHVMLIFSRSGHGFNLDVRLANCVGVIDSDYRGEVKVKLTCDNAQRELFVGKGCKVAQGMVIPYEKVEFVESELADSDRGTGGFGSTGA